MYRVHENSSNTSRQYCGASADRSRGFFLAGAGADLKFDLEPDPIFWVVYGSFFWQLSIKLNNFFILSKSIFSKVFPCLGQNVCFWDKTLVY